MKTIKWSDFLKFISRSDVKCTTSYVYKYYTSNQFGHVSIDPNADSLYVCYVELYGGGDSVRFGIIEAQDVKVAEEAGALCFLLKSESYPDLRRLLFSITKPTTIEDIETL